MKATEVLKKQHQEVLALFKRLEKAQEDSKGEIFEELAARLVGHDAIEREIFYPACEEAMGMTDLLGEALVEHGLVEFSLYVADQALGQDDFDFKVVVLKEALEHHIEEEEKEFFPKAERALGKARLEELGLLLEERFSEALEEDFRAPLYSNLQQVLRGATKVKPRRKTTSASASRTRPTARKAARGRAGRSGRTTSGRRKASSRRAA